MTQITIVCTLNSHSKVLFSTFLITFQVFKASNIVTLNFHDLNILENEV